MFKFLKSTALLLSSAAVLVLGLAGPGAGQGRGRYHHPRFRHLYHR